MKIDKIKEMLWEAWKADNPRQRYELLKPFVSVLPEDYPFLTDDWPTILSDGYYDDEAIVFTLSVLRQISEFKKVDK